MDVIRSLIVSQEVVDTDQIIVMHHNDCGGQHAYRQRRFLLKQMPRYAGPVLGTLVMVLGWFGLDRYLMQPIPDNQQGLEESVRMDVATLRKWMPAHIKIYGLLYDVKDGSVTEICKDVPKDVQAGTIGTKENERQMEMEHATRKEE
jgi:carbonic anhydrase